MQSETSRAGSSLERRERLLDVLSSSVPAYLRTHQILNYGFVTTTDYRPPNVVLDITDSDRRAPHEYRSHRRPVRSSGAGYYPRAYHEWDMYYYITPAYSLGSVQDGVELDNHVTARKTRDFVNTQVWELTFADPHKILGPKRNLSVSTGEANNLTEINANTANMQYKNVLFYKGQFLDYNHNLQARGGTYTNMAGALPIHVVQELAGHSDIRTTRQCYLKVPTRFSDDASKAVEAVTQGCNLT